MRAVLITIADAANRDGENAHPGLPAMIEGSGYSRSGVLQALARLEGEGWIEVTERGGGRGLATVYRVRMAERETVQPVDLFADGNGPVHEAKRSTLEPETVQSSDPTPLTATVSNGSSNVGPSPSAPAMSAPLARRDRLFDAVAAACGVDQLEITPSARGAMNRALAELRSIGADPDEVPHRAAAYRSKFPDVVLSPNALAKHWPTLRASAAPSAANPRRASVGDDSLSAGARWLERQAAR